MRHTRLSPVQRISNFLEDVRRWFGDAFRPSQLTKTPALKIEQAETIQPAAAVKPEEIIIEATKPLTVREALKQRDAARRKSIRDITPPEPPKRSRGIKI